MFTPMEVENKHILTLKTHCICLSRPLRIHKRDFKGYAGVNINVVPMQSNVQGQVYVLIFLIH